MAVSPQIAPTQSSDTQFIKLNPALGWVYGQDNIENEEGAKWAIDPLSMAQGFIYWGMSSNVLADKMQLLTEGIMARTGLPEMAEPSKNGWQSQCGFMMSCVSGEDKGTQVLYKASTMGAEKAFGELYNTIHARLKAKNPEIVPIVLLERGSYPHSNKEFGHVIFPVFNIVGWQGMDDTEVSEEPEAEEAVVEEEAPKRRRRRKVA
jgi:hypothetical protein|tara:strand:+ start:153 stop:770 length:618 start_codon:yes stop_codon:yes gene_type:complete